MLNFALWIQSTEFFSAFRYSHYAYPIVLTCHVAAIALFGGMILIVDLRLLGMALNKRPVADMVEQLRPLKWVGFAILAVCGLMLAGSKAEEYYYNVFFRMKLILLALVGAHALVFRRSVYAQVAAFDRSGRIPGRAKLAAALSLVLWTGLVIAGRGIGYIQPPEFIHAQSDTPAAIHFVAGDPL